MSFFLIYQSIRHKITTKLQKKEIEKRFKRGRQMRYTIATRKEGLQRKGSCTHHLNERWNDPRRKKKE